MISADRNRHIIVRSLLRRDITGMIDRVDNLPPSLMPVNLLQFREDLEAVLNKHIPRLKEEEEILNEADFV